MQIKKTKLLPPYLVLAAVLMMYLLDKFLPIAKWQGTQSFGYLVMLLGFMLILYCAYKFRKHGTEIKPLEESSYLILSWPYTISRNPIYLGMLIFLLGWCVSLQSISSLLVVVAFAVWIRYRFVLQEEVMLEQTFGDEYLVYKQKTRRWL